MATPPPAVGHDALDPRAQRTRQALRQAVTELAGTKRVDDISVSELASKAGINRSTFYRNYDSAKEVLREVLYSDFDLWRSAVTSAIPVNGSLVGPWRQVALGVVGHVEANEAIYVTALGNPEAPSSALMHLTASHFEHSILRHFELHPEVLPVVQGSGAALTTLAFARYVSSGLVGLIRAWVQAPAPRSAQAFADTALAALPAWMLELPGERER
ncbi:TetR/AcrR family transcriptional regulator [Galactobacter caseinivorans]|nr:TetR/AcrR family transcriptional regulator [Galactobacter caseinivorans]